MSRVIIGLLAWFGLGVIIAEIVNNCNFLDFKLKALFVAVPISLTYLLFQLILSHYESKDNHCAKGTIQRRRVTTAYHTILLVIGLCCLASIPFLWWGVIKRIAASANQADKE